MPVSPDVIERIETLGVTITVEARDGIGLDPIAAVPDSLKSELRSRRAEVVAALRLREAIERPDGLNYLLRRLRTGQEWLNTISAQLESTDNVGLGDIVTAATETGERMTISSTTLNDKFVEGFDLWHRLEDCLRNALHFEGCIHGKDRTCDPGGITVCAPCL